MRIANDPLLAEVLRALAGELSWQKLRFAFEKIRSLSGASDNALVKQRYASQDELTRFKADIEDPRLSGIDAVHGVSRGPLKGSKMDESEGFDFVVRLLRKYVDENEIRGPLDQYQPPRARSKSGSRSPKDRFGSAVRTSQSLTL